MKSRSEIVAAMADDGPVAPEIIQKLQAAAGGKAEISPGAAQAIAQSMGGNAALIAALEKGLGRMVGTSSGFIESLPPIMQNRIRYLENLQEQHDELEGEFEEEMEALEKKYDALYAPLQAERAEIVMGKKEAPPQPKEDEAEETPSATKEEKNNDEEVAAGIPEFWLNVLRNYEDIGKLISEKDEGVLEHLVDISQKELDGEDEAGFSLTFTFSDNPYFSNKTLVKTYHMSAEEDNVLESSEATKIEWSSVAKNPTVKVMKKKPKKGGKPDGKPMTKQETVESFFNFFSPPEVPPQGTNLDEKEAENLQELMEEDYEMGDVIREKLIPHAVHWYTGEAISDEYSDEDDEDEDDDDNEDDDDEDDDDDDEDDDDADVEPITDSGEKPPECKQQ